MEALINLWRTQTNDMKYRNDLIKVMKEKGVFPREDIDRDLKDAGLYPDVYDPLFVSQLLSKSEFADTVSSFNPDDDACAQRSDFEVTPVQRFVANLMNPRTPYMSMLLYHGVGVGKTCAAIQAAEAYLEVYPRQKVLIVAPKNIQQGFYKTIFDINRVVLGKSEQEPNTSLQCTMDLYMQLSGTLYSRDLKEIERKVKRIIDSRYEIYGYVAFANRVKSILSKLPESENEETQRQLETLAIQKEFSYRMLIIDEAHNLRDATAAEIEEDIDTTLEEEQKQGKQLTPYLRSVLELSEGMKLLLMTATPMFNNVREIIFLLNLLLLNDKKILIQEGQVLTKDGSLVDGASDVLRPVANAYISFMRGENPNSFPVRLEPIHSGRLTVDKYPKVGLSRDMSTEIAVNEKQNVSRLPIVVSEFQPSVQNNSSFMEDLIYDKISNEGTGYQIIDFLIQASNCIFPTSKSAPSGSESESNSESNSGSISNNNYENLIEPDDSNIGASGFDNCFQKEGLGGRVRVKSGKADWLHRNKIGGYAPKVSTILNSLIKCEGVAFVYSRFVKAGAQLLALVLEANGYTRWNGKQILANGNQESLGKKCALCSSWEKNHTSTDHIFSPAYYVLLTGNSGLSPNNALAITTATQPDNVDGKIIKVILGSQIAGEGLNLQFIRELHILDAWFHLNKTEQIIGRGQRFLSHCLLPKEKRNVTVFLHAINIGDKYEGADLYAYRLALSKARRVGAVSRLLKIYAMDCHLRRGATVLTTLKPRDLLDSQGNLRRAQDVNDKQFTSICDWQECDYKCLPELDKPLDIVTSDDSTYDIFSAQYRLSVLKKITERLFSMQTHYTREELETLLQTTKAPKPAIDMFLRNIINNREFQIRNKDQIGYVIYKNTYYVFQPLKYRDLGLPLAIRGAAVPVKRNEFTPVVLEKPIETVSVVKSENSEADAVDITEFWSICRTWVDGLVRREIRGLTKELNDAIIKRTIDYPKLRDVYKDRIKMIIFLNPKPVHRQEWRRSVLEYIWDEWLSFEEQMATFETYKENEDMKIIGNETYMESGSVNVLRFVNASTNELEYFCQGAPCPVSVKDVFERASIDKDPIKKRKATPSAAGPVYGFIVPKRGVMVFKTNVPHPEGKKPERGQECANVTAKIGPREKLLAIGNALEENDESNMDFDEEHLAVATEMNNATKACTVTDLALRYCDHIRLGELRWFFRPIAAYLSGHRGLQVKSVSAAAKAKSKAAKKATDPAGATAVEKKKIVKKVVVSKKEDSSNSNSNSNTSSNSDSE